MRKPLGTFELLNRQTGGYEPAHLYEMIAQNNIDDFENFWRPAFDQKLKETNGDPDAIRAANIQDHHWKWKEKAKDGMNRIDLQSFAIEADNLTQGLMFVDLPYHRARLESQKNKDLVYVELLATAPWNRPGFTDKPKYKGIGTLMLATAINLSMSEGFHGRIGLHSLPQSSEWYQDVCKMTDLGPDPDPQYVGMHYFEMTEARAQEFIKER